MKGRRRGGRGNGTYQADDVYNSPARTRWLSEFPIKRGLSRKNPVGLANHWRKGSYEQVCLKGHICSSVDVYVAVRRKWGGLPRHPIFAMLLQNNKE